MINFYTCTDKTVPGVNPSFVLSEGALFSLLPTLSWLETLNRFSSSAPGAGISWNPKSLKEGFGVVSVMISLWGKTAGSFSSGISSRIIFGLLMVLVRWIISEVWVGENVNSGSKSLNRTWDEVGRTPVLERLGRKDWALRISWLDWSFWKKFVFPKMSSSLLDVGSGRRINSSGLNRVGLITFFIVNISPSI